MKTQHMTHRTMALVAILAMTVPALAQPTYSIDLPGPTSRILDPTPGKVFGIDILTPTGSGMTPPPTVVISDGAGGLGTILETGDRGRELDALSYGDDDLLLDNLTANPNALVEHHWYFSVDEFAVGAPGVAGPSVTTEGAFGLQEASADVYFTRTPIGPASAGTPGVNTGTFDGNGGLTTFAAPGLNLVEPNPPTLTGVDTGDNVDAFDLDSAPNAPIFFSLDTSFSDPLENLAVRTNFATAYINGFVGGDVLVTSPLGNGPVLYAASTDLGLDRLQVDSDDLDALILNDDGAIHPITGLPYYNPFVDVLLFSVRRGSAIIGTPDSLTGTPIEEGDILIPRLGLVPGIFIPAEALGLATLRTDGTAGTFQGFGDDLNALDVQTSVIPEPASAALMGVGSLLVLARRRTSPPELNFDLLSFPPAAPGSSPGRRLGFS